MERKYPRVHGLLALVTVLASALTARGQQAQIEQSRLLAPATPSASRTIEAASTGLSFTAPEHSDDAFGAQVLLKSQERAKPFTGFAEIGAFVTNNVALTRTNEHGDTFLVASAGGSFSQRLGSAVRLDAGVRGAAYRYGKFSALDFQSVDLSLGATWTPPQLRGAEVVLRYTFTDLTSRKDTREFYNNHAVLLGVQKTVAFSRAHGVYAGVSAQVSWADPAETGRDEYVGFAGYHVQLTRSVDADLSYRYGRFVYREADGRQDNNHAVSLGVRYKPREWVALSASSFASWNRSNRRDFDYDAANLGVGAQVSVRF